jgi:peptidoglycan/xylan/chitin deacetylase (PgdA/CDA1 family)
MKRFFLIWAMMGAIFLMGCGPEAVAPEGAEEAVAPENVEVAEVAAPDEAAMTTRVPILMYHYVREIDQAYDPVGWNLSVSPELFEQHLRYLRDEGWSSVRWADLAAVEVPEKSVVLTFDDGLKDFYTTAWPLLLQYGFGASNAIICHSIGIEGHMTEAEIRELVAEGLELSSHTFSHPNLATLGKEEMRWQMAGCRDYLEKMFGVEVGSVVYPAGKYDKRVLSVAEEAGFDFGLTVEVDFADLVSDDWRALPRVRVDNRWGLEGFVEKMSGFEKL